jgi:hypothetical protein
VLGGGGSVTHNQHVPQPPSAHVVGVAACEEQSWPTQHNYQQHWGEIQRDVGGGGGVTKTTSVMRVLFVAKDVRLVKMREDVRRCEMMCERESS